MFGKVDVTTDTVYSQDIQQLERESHMSWLPQEKLTTEEKETIQEYQRRKTALLGKYNTHIKDIEKSHETWIGNFTAQHKKRLQACQELYATEEQKVDKTVYSTDELQAYAIYQPALDTYKETKARATIKYNKELEALELEFDKVAKEINKKIKERSEKKEEEEREQELQQLKEVIKGIAYDIKRVDKAIEEEDRYINRPEVLALDKALARRYQHKLARHRRVLENRLHRRKEIVKGEGLSLDIAPDEELSDGGYSSVEEFQDKETLPQRHRIKRSRIREPYPSLFEYPHQIPTHHTVDELPADELQELGKRIEAKAKQEKGKKGKAKKKTKPETSEKGEPQIQIPVVEPQEVDRNIQPETPPQTPTMPGRRNNRDDDDDGGQNRNHYWSLRDIPKFEGKGEQPYSHLMEFEDYLVASGIAIEPDENPDYRDIINKFKASLKNNARVWFSMYIENRVPELHSAEGWKTVKSKFLTYFNPIGSTKEQQIKAWKELKWKPEEEKLTEFVFRFSQLAHELGYTEEQQISHFVLCIPRGLYLYLEGAQTVPDAVENLRKGIALGGLDTFGAIARPMQDDSKPTVPFMMMKENKTQEETLRVVKESIHDSMYESSKTLVKQLDKIGDKLTNVVEDFQKKQQTSRGRDRDRNRSNSRDRNNSGDNYRNRSWDRRDNRDRYRNRSGDRRDSRDNSRDRDRGRGRDRSNSREGRRNQPRSGSGQRYFDRNDFCNYCNRTGHATHRCFRLENYLKRKGKRIVLHDDDDVQEIAQAVQDLNTKLNSLKVSNSTNN